MEEPEVIQLLHYMEEMTYENAVNDDLKEMHEMVKTVKKTLETLLDYWKMRHKKILLKRKAQAEGQANGRLDLLVFIACKKLIKKAKPCKKLQRFWKQHGPFRIQKQCAVRHPRLFYNTPVLYGVYHTVKSERVIGYEHQDYHIFQWR